MIARAWALLLGKGRGRSLGGGDVARVEGEEGVMMKVGPFSLTRQGAKSGRKIRR